MPHLAASAAFGLEAVVARELHALGYRDTRAEDGLVRFTANDAAVPRCNLWLRAAERVQVVVAEFDCTDFGDLFDAVREIAWEEWVAPGHAFPVNARSVKSTLHSVRDIQRLAKKAIADRLASLRTGHGGEWVEEDGPPVPVEVSIRKDRVTVLLDTSGEALHRRAYREWVGPAPLKETLAAGIVLLSVWDRDRPLLDPVCGTGTLVTEAALIGRGIAPGRNRSFAAERWPRFPRVLWEEARAEAEDAILPPLDRPLQGTDVDPRAVEVSRRHAELAGVADDCHFQTRPLADAGASQKFGVLLANPPYGERLGDRDSVEDLYREFRPLLERLDTWSACVLTPHPRFDELAGRTAARRRKLYNGRIACTLWQFLGPKPPAMRRGPAYTADQPPPAASPAAP